MSETLNYHEQIYNTFLMRESAKLFLDKLEWPPSNFHQAKMNHKSGDLGLVIWIHLYRKVCLMLKQKQCLYVEGLYRGINLVPVDFESSSG